MASEGPADARPPAPPPPGPGLWAGSVDGLFRAAKVLALLYVFLLSVQLIGDGFRLLGGGSASSLFTGIDNPLVALLIGLLATAVLQSSSTTTAITVGLVAAEAIDLPMAIPMVMGANIGTSVTNTLVSMGHARDAADFERAFAGATVHDIFNLLAVAILLPLELAFGFIERLSGWLVAPLIELGGARFESPLQAVLQPAARALVHIDKALIQRAALGQPVEGSLVDGGLLAATGLGDRALGGLLLALAATLLVMALMGIVRTLKALVESRAAEWLRRALGRSAVVSMGIGAGATVAVQSSSITTSTLVPMVGVGLVTLEAMYPLTLGANVGTTVTALLASMGAEGPGAVLGLQIALCHLLFNLLGIALLYPLPALRPVPLRMARALAARVARRPRLGLAYVGGVFFALPLAALALYEWLAA